MRWGTFFCMLICISLVQSTLINWINIGSAVPDLYFSMVVFYSFLTDVKRNTIANWFTGISKDLFSEGGLGVNSIFFIAAGFFIWSIRRMIFKGHVVTQVVVTFVFSIVYNVLYAAHIAISFNSPSLTVILWRTLTCSLYTAMFVPFLFWIFRKFQPTHNFFIMDK